MTAPVKRTISIVVPAYNEGECVDELARRLQSVFARTDRYTFEAIIVENGSLDNTFEKLLIIRSVDPRFKIIRLQRNFNMEGGMCAGLAHATGDACVIMAGDLQDPPELIPEFIAQWEAGYDNVYQIVTKRADNSLYRRFAAGTFYWLINKISDRPVPQNASDFRLVDRRLYEAFNAMPERNRMVRAMWNWIGGKSIGIEHERPPRFGGISAFSSLRTAGFAIRGILSSSYLPLKLIPIVGGLMGVGSFVALGAFAIRALLFGVPFSGFGTLVSLILMMFGFLFTLLGLISEYVGMIYEEVRARPAFIVREAYGLDITADGEQLSPARKLLSVAGEIGREPISIASEAIPFIR